MGVITSPNRPKTDKTIRIKTDKTDKTIRKFVRDHLNRPKVPKVPIFPIAPTLAVNCKLNPVQTRHTHKKELPHEWGSSRTQTILTLHY